jgi:hypothetical protein
MLPGERELYQRFAAYDDEELLLILTSERALYRREALVAAEMVLMRRSMAAQLPYELPPLPPMQMSPPVAGGPAQPTSPYQAIDFVVDVLLIGSLYWLTWMLDIGSVIRESWLADGAIRLLLFGLLTVGVMYLRNGWRTKTW